MIVRRILATFCAVIVVWLLANLPSYSLSPLGLKLVFVGVVIEGIEIVSELLFKELSEFVKSIFKAIGSVGWLILVIGLFLEFAEESSRNISQANELRCNFAEEVGGRVSLAAIWVGRELFCLDWSRGRRFPPTQGAPLPSRCAGSAGGSWRQREAQPEDGLRAISRR